jgi:hypothetical protein
MIREPIPHDWPKPKRRCNSRIRSGVVATSRLPTGRKQSSPVSFSTV